MVRKVFVAFIVLSSLVLNAKAFGQGHWGYFGIPSLTQEQKNRLDNLWMSFIREALAREAQAEVAKTELRLLLSSDNEDPEAIKAAVAKVSEHEGAILETQTRFVIEIKKVLRPEQCRWLNQEILSRPGFIFHFLQPERPIWEPPGGGGNPPPGPQWSPPQGPQVPDVGPQCGPVARPPEKEGGTK